MMFGISMWLIWKARNATLFAGTVSTPPQIARRVRWWTVNAMAAFERDANCLGLVPSRSWSPVSWDPGPQDTITINTDGSYLPERNLAAAGGIIRTAEGRSLVVFSMNLGCCTITRAEIRGAISGLELAWNYGYRQVELRLDSQAAISILTSRVEPLHQYAAEVCYFREICSRDWIVQTRHIVRRIRLPTSLRARVIDSLLVFICFPFLIVTWVTS
ncbi:Putative ribonuclease H protein At1g65750 [Linum perenne]